MFDPGIKDIVNIPVFIIDKYTEITGISLGKIFVVDFIDTEAFRKASALWNATSGKEG